MKGKKGIKTEVNLSQEHTEFLEIVKLDIEKFLKNYEHLYFVLLFPPLNSFRRFLIHDVVQNKFSTQGLETFSVGQDSSRRTAICHRSQLLLSSLPSDGCEKPESRRSKMLENEVIVNASIKSKSKPVRSLNIYQPPAVRAAERRKYKPQTTYEIKSESPVNSKDSRKGRRPDQQRYVPRPLRSDSAEPSTTEKTVTVEDLKITCLNSEAKADPSLAKTPTIHPKEISFDIVLTALNERKQATQNTVLNSSTPKPACTLTASSERKQAAQNTDSNSCTPKPASARRNSNDTSPGKIKRISLDEVKTKNHFLEYLDSVVASSPKADRVANGFNSSVKREKIDSEIVNDCISPVKKKLLDKNDSVIVNRCISLARDEIVHGDGDSSTSPIKCKTKIADEALVSSFDESFCSTSSRLNIDSLEGSSSKLGDIINSSCDLETEISVPSSSEGCADRDDTRPISDGIPPTKPLVVSEEKRCFDSKLKESLIKEDTTSSSQSEIIVASEKSDSDKKDVCSKRKEVEDDEIHSETKVKHRHLNGVPHVLVISEPSTLPPLSLPSCETSGKPEKETNRDEPTCMEKASGSQNPSVIDKSHELVSDLTKSELRIPSECDSWELLYDDETAAVEPAIVEELSKSVGKVKIATTTNDYSSFQTIEERTSNGECIIEIYGFPAEFTTRDLLTAFAAYRNKSGFHIKWVDDTHALAIFNSPLVADEVLTCDLPFVKTRPLRLGVAESRVKARSILLPPATRPKTCPALARRLVTGALGIRVRADKKEREAEKLILKEARDQRRLAAKQKDAAWEGTIASNL